MQFESDDIILYPTDTLYGLGVDATNLKMVRRLKELKGSGGDKHFSIAVSDVAMLRRYAEVTPLAERLIEKFLPGKLTLVLHLLSPHLSGQYPDIDHLGALCADGTIGVRIPAHEGALRMIRAFGRPITATSANVSGMAPEKTPENILAQFGPRAHFITKVVDEGELPPSEPSTVVDARGETPIIIREGAIPTSVIMAVL